MAKKSIETAAEQDSGIVGRLQTARGGLERLRAERKAMQAKKAAVKAQAATAREAALLALLESGDEAQSADELKAVRQFEDEGRLLQDAIEAQDKRIETAEAALRELEQMHSQELAQAEATALAKRREEYRARKAKLDARLLQELSDVWQVLDEADALWREASGVGVDLHDRNHVDIRRTLAPIRRDLERRRELGR